MTKTIKNYWLFILTFIAIITIWLTNTNHSLFFAINSQHVILPTAIWNAIIFLTLEKNGILPLLLLIITFIFRREKVVNVILLIAAYYVLFYLLKITFHEARPFIQHNPLTFHWLPQPDIATRSYRSFPSGHTGNMAIFVFALSRLFAQNKLWLRVILLVLLVFTMLAQICTGWHFPIDVLSSALIGFILVEFYFSRFFEQKFGKKALTFLSTSV